MDDNKQMALNLLDIYFRDRPSFLVGHHLESYNDFFDKGISQLLKEKNPIHFFKNQEKITIDEKTKHIDYFLPNGIEKPVTFDEMKELFPSKSQKEYEEIWSNAKGDGPIKTLTKEEYRYQCQLYIGGKTGKKIYYGKPIIYNKDSDDKFMYPNEARLKNFTYAFTIHYDIDIDFTLYLPLNDGSNKYKIEKFTTTLEKIYLGKFPIMLRSNLCILNNLSPEIRNNMGEDPSDLGGYFIIDGKEKVIVSQEKFADNMLYVQKDPNDLVAYSAKIRSVSEDASKPVRTLVVKMVKETSVLSNQQIVVSIPNVRKDIPLFIVMRALGILSDKEIVEYILLDLDKYSHYFSLLRPSVHDAGYIFTQEAALKFIATFTKGKTISHAMQILMNYFLPHIGELNFKQKAHYLGYITKRMLMVATNEAEATNRDSYVFKRIEIPGTLIYDLFKEYYTLQQNDIFLQLDKEYFFAVKKNARSYQNKDFFNLILENQSKIFSNRIVENGFKKAFKGDWGAESHTKKIGALQDLNRLSFFGTMAQMRKANIPIGADGAKIVGPRYINSTQWGIFCPIHSPDGGNVGLHKHFSILAHITKKQSGHPFIEYFRKDDFGMVLLEECTPKFISDNTKVFINGAWLGVTPTPQEFKSMFILHRRNGLFNIFTSINWNLELNEIHVQTDAGRPCHPLLHITDGNISYNKEDVFEKIKTKDFTWEQCVLGTGKPTVDISIDNDKIYPSSVLKSNIKDTEAIIEYLDTQEMQGVMLASESDTKETMIKKKITHKEIHPSAILSMMANQVIFPSTNPYPRNAFSCGQSKQAVSMFNTNFNFRMDKSAILLNSGQNPIVRSRYYKHVTNDKHPYGVNAIVAIACYTGYNVEDSIIVNKAALDRGLFRTTYFNTYESKEETTTIGNMEINSKFMNIENNEVIGLKPGYDYSKLEKSGLIKENVLVDDKTILIGKTSETLLSDDHYTDESIGPKKGQLGYVDKSFMCETENGKRLSKVRIRHDRIPMIGDKFCSRAGQKGTIGIVLEEKDMPFNEFGQRPDIIVNPHALPSRMTIGHLVEALIGKACVFTGGLGDCTAFQNKGSKEKAFGKLLTKEGFASTGNEILYNGMTGEQLETDIYFGPTYYLRLKHMVKDKINYRARGPRAALTRQTVQGRANDGGLRIGEMDRDAILSHGMKSFIYESMMERGDKYYMAICNNTGTLAVYNENKNIFLSPMLDGPLKFTENLEGGLNIVQVSKYGRSFSIVKVPYAFKLLYHELQAMNVQMRIITSSNIEELTRVGKTKNIEKLTNNKEFTQLPNKIKSILAKDNKKYNEIKELIPEYRESKEKDDDDITEWKESDFKPGIVYNPGATPRIEKPIEVGDEVLIKNDPAKEIWVVTGIDEEDVIIQNKLTKEVEFRTINNIEIPKVNAQTPEFVPQTPEHGPQTPEHGPQTPEHGPQTPEHEPQTPEHGPQTPQYAPHSPGNTPQTPDMGPKDAPYGPMSPLYSPTPAGTPVMLPPGSTIVTSPGLAPLSDDDLNESKMPELKLPEAETGEGEIITDDSTEKKELLPSRTPVVKNDPHSKDVKILLPDEENNKKTENKDDEDNNDSDSDGDSNFKKIVST